MTSFAPCVFTEHRVFSKYAWNKYGGFLWTGHRKTPRDRWCLSCTTRPAGFTERCFVRETVSLPAFLGRKNYI